MAVGVSGVIQHKLYNDYYIVKHGYSYVDVYYREEYDVASNTSVIVIPQITFRHSLYGGTWTVYGTVTIDGREYSFGGDISSGGVIEHPITSHPICHDEVTGAKTVTISTACNTVGGSSGTQLYAGNHGTATATVPLTTIPRISAVKAADGVIGEAVGITVDRSNSLFTHTLRYGFGEATGVIAENTSATELLWTPPMELCNQIPNHPSADCILTCETYNGESIIGSRETTITLTVPPEVGLVPMEGWATVQPYHPMLAESGITAYVQGYSKAQVTFDASKISLGKSYGASVASFSVVHNGSVISAPYVTSVLQTAGGTELICRVTDTRGKVVSQAVSITVEAYSKPTLSQIAVFRCVSDGTEHDEGTYVSVTATGNFSSIAGQNRGVLHVAVGDAVSCEIPNSVTTVLGDGAILNTATYPMTLTFTDRLGNKAAYTQLLPTADVMFHGRKGGRGAAFGKYAEQDDLLDVGWDLFVRKNLAVDGGFRVKNPWEINLKNGDDIAEIWPSWEYGVQYRQAADITVRNAPQNNHYVFYWRMGNILLANVHGVGLYFCGVADGFSKWESLTSLERLFQNPNLGYDVPINFDGIGVCGLMWCALTGNDINPPGELGVGNYGWLENYPDFQRFYQYDTNRLWTR